MLRCKKHQHQGAHHLGLAKVTVVKMSSNTSTWFIRWCGRIYYYLVLVSVCVCGTGRNQSESDSDHVNHVTRFISEPR